MDALYRALHGAPTPDVTFRGGPGLLALVAGYAGLLLLHEGVHWAAFRLYGARPRFCLLLKPFPGAAVYEVREERGHRIDPLRPGVA